MLTLETCPSVDAPALSAILDRAQQARSRLRNTPIARIVEVLARVGTIWGDPSHALRREAQNRLPTGLRFSPEMVSRGLDAVAAMLQSTALEKRLHTELRWPQGMHRWVPAEAGGMSLKAEPLGVVLHVASGNVFVAPAISLAEGFLTRNVNVLKAASCDRVFPHLFARSIEEADQDAVLTDAYHVVHWAGGTRDLETLCKRRCDGILVWGGEAAIRDYTEGLSPTTRLIPYGPRLSFAGVAREAMRDAPEVARRLAQDVVAWDQQSCASPQLVYVEDDDRGNNNALRLVADLPKALEAAARTLPAGPLDADEMAELTLVRETARMDAAMDQAVLCTPGRDQSWTVIYQRDPRFTLSCLFRTLLVKRVRSLEDIPAHVQAVRGYLQTVALAAPMSRKEAIADLLAEAGATRIVPLGGSARVLPGEPHDGQLALERLVRWVTHVEDGVSWP